MTSRPNEFANHIRIKPDTSEISLSLKVGFGELEKQLNEKLTFDIIQKGGGEWDSLFQAKTGNPAYHPNKWIKTKDPLYNKKKWIRIGGFKSKNPFYHPNKWIKTRDPLYNPNKWIYADVVRLQVGYTYKYRVRKDGRINVSNHRTNHLRVEVPITLDGQIGFKGDWAHFTKADKKDIKAGITVIADIALGLDSNWCPQVKTKVHHEWSTTPRIELAKDRWLPLTWPADISLRKIEKSADSLVREYIDCEAIRAEFAKAWKNTSINVTEGLYANLQPISASSSNLIVQPEDMSIFLTFKSLVELSTKPLENNTPVAIPPLGTQQDRPGFVDLKVPVMIDYKTIAKAINDSIKREEVKFDVETPVGDAVVEIDGIELYPTGSELTVGVRFQSTFKNKLLSSKGKVFLSAKPVIDKHKLYLDNITFHTVVDNNLYPVVGTLFKKKIMGIIKEKTTHDFSEKLHNIESQIYQEITEKVILPYSPKSKISKPEVSIYAAIEKNRL